MEISETAKKSVPFHFQVWPTLSPHSDFKPKANIHCAEDSPEEVVRLQENSHGKEELGNNAISHNKGGSYVEPALTINGLSNFVFPP